MVGRNQESYHISLEDVVEYTKVDGNDVSMVALAKASGFSVKDLVTAENQRRYRLAYNKNKNAQMKLLREYLKQHPNALKGGE